jgi:plastocyanin
MFQRFLISSLVFVTYALANSAVNFDVVWDGGNNLPEVTILVGDTVIWSREDSAPFVFSGTEFTATLTDGVYSYSFMMPGDYYYGVATEGGSAGGVVKVKEGHFFDEIIDYYHLKIGDILRWSWEGSTPNLPTDFDGFCPHPGVSHSGPNHFDYTFLIPGEYRWFANADQQYKFEVESHDTGKHLNINWNSYTNYWSQFEVGTLLRFYVTDEKKHNVRVVGANEDGSPMDPNTALWVSEDFEHAGESVYYAPMPGLYYATSDYDPDVMFGFEVYYPKDKKENKKILPKSVVYVAEVSLFMIGLLGLGNMIMDQFDKKDKKDKKDSPAPPPPPPSDEGGDITAYALQRAQQRVAAAAAKRQSGL